MTFITLRFNISEATGQAPILGAAARAAILDRELEAMQSPDLLALAKRRRNMALPACRLPSELLTRIVCIAQLDWIPSRGHMGLGRMPTLGWMITTHVCFSWRNVR